MMGLPFTCGFKPNHGTKGAYDAVVYERLKAAGGLFVLYSALNGATRDVHSGVKRMWRMASSADQM